MNLFVKSTFCLYISHNEALPAHTQSTHRSVSFRIHYADARLPIAISDESREPACGEGLKPVGHRRIDRDESFVDGCARSSDGSSGGNADGVR